MLFHFPRALTDSKKMINSIRASGRYSNITIDHVTKEQRFAKGKEGAIL